MAFETWEEARDDWLRTLAAQDAPLAREIQDAYASTRRALDRALADMQRKLAASGVTTRAQVRRSEAWEAFNRKTAREFATLEGVLQDVTAAGVDGSAGLGADAAQRLVQGLARDPLAFGWNRPDPAALRAMSDRLKGQLAQQIGVGKFANASSQKVADLFLAGMAQGYNPRRIAALATQIFNVPAAWALSHARTAQIYAYRDGTLEGYRANSNIVRGWIWAASLDSRTCPSCWSMHGTKHAHGETLNDHHLGRCCAIPDLGINSVVNVIDGETAFARLSAEDQRKVMGPTVWQGWKDGKVDFKAMSREYRDETYGTMRRAASAKELLGETP